MNKVEKGLVTKYTSYPNETTKRAGKNTKIWSNHHITVDGLPYFLEAEGTRQWAFLGDTITFEWSWQKRESYTGEIWNTRVIAHETFRAWNKKGEEVIRGIRERNKPRRGQPFENEVLRRMALYQKIGISFSEAEIITELIEETKRSIGED